MTNTSGAAPGSFNDPYSNHTQYAGEGVHQPVVQARAPQTEQKQTQQPSTKALAITSRATRGTAPPPLMGSAIVLVNDSALHCFGGRLENRQLTNCHYVLDVETGYWGAVQPAPATEFTNGTANRNAGDAKALFSLSLTTDPVNTNSGSLSDALSIPPRARYFHTLNAYGTSLILFGGMGDAQTHNDGDDSDNEGADRQNQLVALGDLHVYDIVTQRWQQKHPAANRHRPRARWAHLATILDHFLIVIGGTDTAKVYVEDACVLDLHTWEWVASIQNIGQCGSYRTVAATGPSLQTASEFTPSSPSFPSAAASSPQISSSLSWPATDSGPIDAMASISMVLSGRISAPSSTASSQSKSSSNDDIDTSATNSNSSSRKTSERLMSGELTPSFKTGNELPAIYLYSNYNFQNLQRDLKVITPHYTHSASAPSFTLTEKKDLLDTMVHELPAGLRFPQGHVYQNQLILTGTLIVSGEAPTLAIYAFNLTLRKWEKLNTDTTLEYGSWNRTLLHPATGTLLIFGNRDSNAELDYSNRTQHHDHLMMINLQAYGLYERPVPSYPPTAQDLGQDLLKMPGLNDMTVASVTGTLFDANSTILAARWPEFSTMLLSPPYVTPLILELPVPDEVVPVFLHYLYTGALPPKQTITPGTADYLLILARRYQLNGLHALTVDCLHQTVAANPIRIYSSALMASELGLQARAVGLAMTAAPVKASAGRPPSRSSGLPPGPGVMSSMDRPPSVSRRRISVQPQLDPRLSRSFSNKLPPPSSRPPGPPPSRRQDANSIHSRDSVSTDGGLVGETLLQQYNADGSARLTLTPRGPYEGESQQQALYLSSPEPGAMAASATRQRKLRSPPVPPNLRSYQQQQQQQYQQQSFTSHHHPVSFMSTSSGGSSGYDAPLTSPGIHRNPQQSYPSPLSPNYQQHSSSFSSQGMPGERFSPMMRGPGSDGTASVYGHEEQDDGASVYGQQGREMRTQQAKRRLQMQMQAQFEVEQQQQQQQHYQQELARQQQLRDEDIMLQQHRFLQKQQQLRAAEAETAAAATASRHKPAEAVMSALEYHMGGGGGGSSSKSSGSHHKAAGYPSSQMTVESQRTVETMSSQKSSGSSKANSIKSSKSDEAKKKGLLSKMKPPKPKASGAALMKSAGF
ncbi:hypothetical protein BGZ67_009751 [Mortierella alpina]|nr:hypothetical protein BGZ67_009751 [Mortierella alpina]